MLLLPAGLVTLLTHVDFVKGASKQCINGKLVLPVSAAAAEALLLCTPSLPRQQQQQRPLSCPRPACLGSSSRGLTALNAVHALHACSSACLACLGSCR